MVIKNVLDMIGNTPLVDLSPTMGCQIYAKAEFLNLGGSIKDRVAKNMIEAAEKEGKLKKGMTIVEPTSGNTRIGLALCGVRMGYKVIIVMPGKYERGAQEDHPCSGRGAGAHTGAFKSGRLCGGGQSDRVAVQ